MTNSISSVDSGQIVELLRSRIFSLTARDLGLHTDSCPNVWGVIIELCSSQDAVTLVALADGSVSVYMGSGKGRIGCGLHAEIRAMGARMLTLAQAALAGTTPAARHAAPAEGHVLFYFHTASGLRGVDVLRTELEQNKVDLADIYGAGRAIIEAVELMGAGQSIADAIQDAAQSVLSQPGRTAAELRKGSPCRILPSAGSAAHRSRR